jgi:predicted transcriptional regulator
MRALSIRQPYAEQILRGLKTIEYRSRPTRIIGERFYIYAAKKWAGVNGHDAPGNALTPALSQGERELMPSGVIVGTATISRCTKGNGHPALYCWHLSDVRRLPKPRKPKGRPQPVWFRPF